DSGALVPTIASTPPADAYMPDGILAISPRPGFVLAPAHKHAFVVMKKLGDASGKPLAAPRGFVSLSPSLSSLYPPLFPALAKLGVNRDDVAVATVFTTGDVVADTFALSEKVKAAYTLEIKNVRVDPDDGTSHERYCELLADVTYPQFQRGVAPF